MKVYKNDFFITNVKLMTKGSWYECGKDLYTRYNILMLDNKYAVQFFYPENDFSKEKVFIFGVVGEDNILRFNSSLMIPVSHIGKIKSLLMYLEQRLWVE